MVTDGAGRDRQSRTRRERAETGQGKTETPAEACLEAPDRPQQRDDRGVNDGGASGNPERSSGVQGSAASASEAAVSPVCLSEDITQCPVPRPRTYPDLRQVLQTAITAVPAELTAQAHGISRAWPPIGAGGAPGSYSSPSVAVRTSFGRSTGRRGA